MSTAIFSLINAIDLAFAPFLPLALRISFWGLLAGVAAMAVYALTSNQRSISILKKEIKEHRRHLLDPSVDSRSEYTALAGKNLKASMALLGKVIVPAALSALPVLLVAWWMDAYHAHTIPEGLFRGLPPWASGWEFPYFFSVLAAALAIKLVFKIH